MAAKQRTINTRRRVKQQRSSNAQSVRITITTTARVKEHLETLVDTGLYGSSVAETAERLICDGLLRRVKQANKETKGK